MDVNVDVENENYIPNSLEGTLINIFKNTKVSFVLLLIFVIFIYVLIFLLVGSSSSSNEGTVLGVGKNMIVLALEFILWIFLIIIIYINVKNYDDKGLDFQAKLMNLFDTKIAELSVNVNDTKDLSGSDETESDEKEKCKNNENDTGKEVFHIADNKFTFEEAKDICESYGARLATYDEIEEAYNQGASWCSYGWSDDQMAFFPTQKKVYNDLKQIKGHENDCGRPGVNGGYISNSKIKFGVNCFGIKPKAKDTDEVYMHSINHSPAVTKAHMDKSHEENNKYKDYIVASFNKDKWTKYS